MRRKARRPWRKTRKVALPARRCSMKQPRLKNPGRSNHCKANQIKAVEDDNTAASLPEQKGDNPNHDFPPQGFRRKFKTINNNLKRTKGKAIAAYLRLILLAALIARTTACDEGISEHNGDLQNTCYNLLNCRQHPQLYDDRICQSDTAMSTATRRKIIFSYLGQCPCSQDLGHRPLMRGKQTLSLPRGLNWRHTPLGRSPK